MATTDWSMNICQHQSDQSLASVHWSKLEDSNHLSTSARKCQRHWNDGSTSSFCGENWPWLEEFHFSRSLILVDWFWLDCVVICEWSLLRPYRYLLESSSYFKKDIASSAWFDRFWTTISDIALVNGAIFHLHLHISSLMTVTAASVCWPQNISTAKASK